MLKEFTKSVNKLKSKDILFILIIIFLCSLSFGKAINSYFWKDDWAWLWSANYNPQDFFYTTVGNFWLARTGLFMYPYVLVLHKYIHSSVIWQFMGLGLKFINSVLIYFFIYAITRKKHIAMAASFIYASYSGGIESYTWHKLNALATSFVLLGFFYYKKYLDSFKTKHFIISVSMFVFSVFSYVGRASGLVMVVILWNILVLVKRDIDIKKRKKIIYTTIFFLLSYILFSKLVLSLEPRTSEFFIESFKKYSNFFGIIGNLIKNPFVRTKELGYLADLTPLSYFLGYGLLIAGLVIGIKYLFKPSDRRLYYLLFIGWIFLFYITNWIFGGGGVNTIISSGHRYLSLSAVGVVALISVFLSTIPKKKVHIITIILIILNIRYSSYLIGLESLVRDRNKIIPIHMEIINKVADDKSVRFILIDTPNRLKSFVAGGWFPYTFAYYRGITDISDFPTVFPFWQSGSEWLCAANETEREAIAQREGVSDYQKGREFTANDVYAWSVSEDGKITDKTEIIRRDYQNCLNSKD